VALWRGDAAAAALRGAEGVEVGSRETELAHAKLVLARSYGFESWSRLVLACRLLDAIWSDDADRTRALIREHRELLHETARGGASDWGPPMSYAANLGRDRIVTMLHELGATDVQHAFDRACLQGQLETARLLLGLGAQLLPGCVMGPCETLNADGLAFLLVSGAQVADEHHNQLAPVALVLQTYSRDPVGKHRCLELLQEHGSDLPDTPALAVHRGRVDRLAAHLVADPELLSRTFSHQEIYPPLLGCDTDESLALHGTPLAGTTLLHLAVDYDELELAQWLLDHGADPDARADVDEHGFGGHTPLFGCVVSQPCRVGLRTDDVFACLLLDRGADPNVRASLRKRLRFTADESLREYRQVTPTSWGRRFHDRDWVNEAALRLIGRRGGRE
jgi:ankyrin repeat protein